tara:strand:+ start:484 stop:675 length:192 start_codon:yes stop_codon:yes gene_type:complete
MTIKKNLLILIPMFFLLGIATFSLYQGVAAAAAPKHLKQKISQTKIKKRPLRNHYYLLFLLST